MESSFAKSCAVRVFVSYCGCIASVLLTASVFEAGISYNLLLLASWILGIESMQSGRTWRATNTNSYDQCIMINGVFSRNDHDHGVFAFLLFVFHYR